MAHGDPRPTKAQRREAARAEAARLRAEQEARAKRTRTITIAGIVGLILVVAGVVWFVLANAKDEPSEPTAGQETVELTGEQTSENHSAATGGHAADAGSISFGSDLKPGGVNEGAPVVELYADFTCPHCFTFEQTRVPKLMEMAKNGEITFVQHPVAILDGSGVFTAFPSRAADAYYAIAKGDPDKASAAATKFFELWHNYQTSGNQAAMPVTADLAKAASEAGVKQDIVDAIANGSVPRVAKAATEAMGKAGLRGTPSLLVNGAEVKSENWGADADGSELRDHILEITK